MSILQPADKIYLAGPFFNAPQIGAAKRVANLCAFHNRIYFAPLLAGGGPLKSPEHATEVFASNCRELNRSKVVLAQLEWLMEPDRQVRVVDPISLTSGIFASPPLNIPDSGTVWEVGYAACLRLVRQERAALGLFGPPFVIAYTTAPQARLNLMLARSCDAYLQGWDAVEKFLASGEIPQEARKFSGKEQ